ncbi:MAG: hypothetical protein ACE5JP_10900 [Candidatus Bipolaricaulia bacterium]
MTDKTSSYVLTRLEAIQKELDRLRELIGHKLEGEKRTTKLEGLWEGVEITEEDFEEAERAVFEDAYSFED